ncbi:MAG: EAL domain-containing protein [Gallionella sp.]|jgi:diguanylate cyclase (GGDEF)-like protein/PAS domain S-box-containing protein|nr:EAL domain-containing protein [Gallionella sp.]MCK9355080.1 EAL domain-containing protein [Gallionella sp.]
MRITTRLRIISIVTVAALVVLAPVLVWSFTEFKSAKNDYVLANAIKVNSFERASFRDQYFLYREDRARMQWDNSKETADRLLHQAGMQFRREEDRQVLERLRRHIEDTALIFHRIVNNTAGLKNAAGSRRPVYEEFDKRLSSQLLLKAAAVRDTATALQDASAQRVEQSYQHLTVIIGLFAVTLALATILTAMHLGRLIRKRLIPLHDGAKIVAGGDLDYRINEGGADEFSELALSINAMTDSLQVSNKHLQAEIAERKLTENVLRIAAISFESQEGILITDANALVLQVNKAFTKITGYGAEEVIGRNASLLQSGRHGPEFYAAMWQSIDSAGSWEGEIWNKRKDGKAYPEHLIITAVKDANGVVTNFVGTLTDITKTKAAADEIKHLAFYDTLTRLPNRRLMVDRLNQALASSARSGRNGALLFIDLDDFKTLNDTLGHDIGDLLLQQVAERLTACVREGDTVARLGGDEFVVMLEELSEQSSEAATQAEVVGTKVLASLNQPYQLNSHLYYNTPSIGATLFNDHHSGIEELLKQADIAMYQAKHAGRNTLRFFDPEMQASISARAALEADLRLALEKSQFELYYQLQATHDGRVIGAEVLIRWQHPARGLVSPVEFIPLAEETGLILPIGLWVLETACAQLGRWKNNPLASHLQLAVNVSARQFHQPAFVEQVLAVLGKFDIDPGKLKLELTESLVLDDIDATILKMHALMEFGVRFSMDDFGTGFSSLAYLTQLPLAQLKIDQSFVRNIGVKPSDAIIVQTIIGMAKNLEMAVIAEGVETEEQRAFLEQHGCPLCQGYLFSKPVPLGEFESLLKPG